VRTIMERLKGVTGKKYILVLNKIDETPRAQLMELALKLNQSIDFLATFMISAKKEDGVEDLAAFVAKQMPEGPYLYPEDQMTDMPLRLLAAEITREKLFRSVHDEIPYDLTVETENWEEFEDGSVKIEQVVYLAREAQKKIVLGKGGAMIGKVGTQAREELEEILERRVHLKLFVKVREDWQNKAEHYNLWGLSHTQKPDAESF
jgi:GTP-binding protein Era